MRRLLAATAVLAALLCPAVAAARNVRLAVVLCKFTDKPAETHPRSFYADYFVRRGARGLSDYWSDVTFGAIDLASSEVFGWFAMNHASGEVRALAFPGGRETLVQWGRDAARANGVDLSRYDGVVIVQNWGVDHGMASSGVVFVDQDSSAIEPTFYAHELGHLLGLPHSFGDPGGEYADPWDIMSAMNVYSFTGTFGSWSGRTGPGINVFAARALGALGNGRVRRIDARPFKETIELAPLDQRFVPNAIYAIEMPPFTIEYRHKAGWDQGLPSDAVLVHEEKNGRSYLEKVLHAGEQFATPHGNIDVLAIDAAAQRAVVRVTSGPGQS